MNLTNLDCVNKIMRLCMDFLFNPRIEQRARARDNPWIACSKHGFMLTPGQPMDSPDSHFELL